MPSIVTEIQDACRNLSLDDAAATAKQQMAKLNPNVNLPAMRISGTILDRIGQSPMVRLNKIGKEEGIACELRIVNV